MAPERLGDLQRLLAGIRLRDQHFIDIHAQGPCVGGVQCVLRVYKRHLAALFLGLRRHMEGKGRLTGGLRPVDLDHTALRKAAQSQGNIQA